MYYRTDVNGSWSTPVDILMIPHLSILRTSGAISEKTNTLHILWTDTELHGDLHYSSAPLATAGDPRAWSTPILLTPNAESASIAVDTNGVLHVIYGSYDQEGLQLDVDHIQSNDDGLSWTQPATIFSTAAPVRSGISAQFTIDGAGRFHVGITMRSLTYGVYSEVGYLRSSDGGKTWGPYMRINASKINPAGAQVLISVNLSTASAYAFGQNEVHLTWHDPRRMHMWSSDGGVTWSVPDEIMPLAPGLGGPNALAQDSAGVIHVVTAVGGGVYSASWDGKQWSAPEQIEFRPIDPHAQSLIVCQGNQLYVTYDDRNDTVKLWYSSRQVKAPHIAQQPPPMPTLVAPSPTRSAAAISTTVNTSNLQNPVALPKDLVLPKSDPLYPLVLAVAPVLLLIAGVYGLRRRR